MQIKLTTIKNVSEGDFEALLEDYSKNTKEFNKLKKRYKQDGKVTIFDSILQADITIEILDRGKKSAKSARNY